jgi:NADPH-dependent glutamate synthase beta subunit-like oxidoreductase
MGGSMMGADATGRYYQTFDIDQVMVDAQRCLACQQTQGCVSHCALGLDIPQAMAAIAQRAFVVREGVREELEEAAAEAFARRAVNNSFSQ